MTQDEVDEFDVMAIALGHDSFTVDEGAVKSDWVAATIDRLTARGWLTMDSPPDRPGVERYRLSAAAMYWMVGAAEEM